MVFLAFAENSVQLVPDGTIFLHIFLILLMIWVLNRTLFKPINRVLADREKLTGGRSGEAGDILHQADAKLTEYERALRQARTEGYTVVENTRREALAARQQQIAAVKEETTQLIEGERAALQSQTAQTQNQLQADARVLAERITAQVLRQGARV
ncbi:MAG TPA: ATP synthase F0 subunit B [Pyrinomonadaceae bacterium]|jgi:F-type H+-transporting ATPase subunit b|nr:ATP synthase F0 subunit B [Pyrinomonadaceae bacterium]